MSVSRRLTELASLVPRGARVCDIGTDHAWLPILLMREGIATHVIATDKREKPLANAQKNIKFSGVPGIETRLGDGLSVIDRGEADVIVIAGIGGEVISAILSRCQWLNLPQSPVLILQPTTSPECLRRFLRSSGFAIEKELPVEENGKLYSILRAVFTGKVALYEEWQDYIGGIDPANPAGRQYIQKQICRLQTAARALIKIPARQEEGMCLQALAEKMEHIIRNSGKA